MNSSQCGRFGLYLDNTPAIICMKCRGVITYQNHLFCQLFGDQIGKTDHEFLDAALADVITANDRTVMASGVPLRIVENVPLPDGTPRSWLSCKFKIDENCLGGISLDITDQIEIQKELQRSNRELEQLAYVASHDLQAPLRAISGFLERLEQRIGTGLDEKARGYIDRTIAASERMKALLNDLLAYSRVSRSLRRREMVDLEVVLWAAADNLESAIRESGAQIRAGVLPAIMGDRSSLVQLFQNLLSNAIKFCDSTPQIEITAVSNLTHYVFSVADNGIGIEPQYTERIFGLFQRLHTQSEYEGTGLGLAICQQVVQQHGGRIWIESTPGVGTTFHFTLRRK